MDPTAHGTAARAWRATVLAALGVAFVAGSVAAQTIGGRVLHAGGGPVPGAFVVMLDSAGQQRAAALADSVGAYQLRAPAPGEYRLRAERIGLESSTSAAFSLAAGQHRTLDLTLADDAVPLAAIEVVGRNRCRIRPATGEATARVWEEVRKALRVSGWAGSGAGYLYATRRRHRVLELPSRRVRSDSVRDLSSQAARPYAAISAEDLRTGGYVRRDDRGDFVYYAPDEAVLASEIFLDTHCLQLVGRGADAAGRLTVAFRPVRRGPPDIQGTAVLDPAGGTLDLRFRYVHLDPRLPADSAGGRVEYRRLPTGAWIVDRWRLTFPEFRVVRGASFRGQHVGGEVVAKALDETTGEVLRIETAGGEPILEAPTGRLATLAGSVYDSLHARPLAGAEVRLAGTPHRDTTDAAGRFRIAAVPSGRYAVEFTWPGADSLPVRPAAVTVAVDSGAAGPLVLATPSLAGLEARLCPDAEGPGDARLVFGQVSGVPAGAARVNVSWQELAGSGAGLMVRARSAEIEPDADGRYVFCGGDPERPLVLRSLVRDPDSRAVSWGPAVRLEPTAARVVRVDLAPPQQR